MPGKFEGTPPLNRYGHTATSIGPHVLIFGGWEFNRATNEVVVLRDMNVGAPASNKKKWGDNKWSMHPLLILLKYLTQIKLKF